MSLRPRSVPFCTLLASILVAPTLAAQSGGAGGTVAREFESLHFRSIGPATMSGRVADLAVYEANPAIYYVGTAHGGVWKTTSGGTMFTPLFQDNGLMAILTPCWVLYLIVPLLFSIQCSILCHNFLLTIS